MSRARESWRGRALLQIASLGALRVCRASAGMYVSVGTMDVRCADCSSLEVNGLMAEGMLDSGSGVLAAAASLLYRPVRLPMHEPLRLR